MIINNEPESSIFAFDVCGIGESKPSTCRDRFFHPYDNDYFYVAHSIMFFYPYAGQKTYDVLKILNWLESYVHEIIHLVGKGWGAIPATSAAILSDKMLQITLRNALTSYIDIAESEEYNWPLSSLVREY